MVDVIVACGIHQFSCIKGRAAWNCVAADLTGGVEIHSLELHGDATAPGLKFTQRWSYFRDLSSH